MAHQIRKHLAYGQLHGLPRHADADPMIYVTHDQIEALTLGDRICVLNQGRIMQVDTPVNLYNHPANRFVAGFIGSPSMNLIDAVVREIANFKFFCNFFDNFLNLFFWPFLHF